MNEKLIRAINSFDYFVNNVFSKSFKDWVGGEYINRIGRFMDSKRTMRVSARDHFKSTSFYAHFLWESIKNADRDMECHYFSYQQSMAGYHISKIRRMLQNNPILNNCIDKKPNAENVMKITWDNVHFHTLAPHGLLSFKRGIHCDIVYIDDPFQDPASKLLNTVIKKINNVIKTQILDMPKKGGQLHIAGTPQTTIDFFFDKSLRETFDTLILPAITDEKNKKTLWPEWMDWEELMKRKEERGEKIFRQEYLCSPVYVEEAFFARDKINAVIGSNQPVNIRKEYESDNDIIAGFDVGKKIHPSHLAVFEKVDGKRKMIFQKFMDGWDYVDQVDYLKTAIDNLGIDELYYDATRGEFESLFEQGLLPDKMTPINFTTKTKNAMATEFEKAVSQNTLELLNNKRMIEQILLVDNDLNAIETPEGHGDSFWSIALSFCDLTQATAELSVV